MHDIVIHFVPADRLGLRYPEQSIAYRMSWCLTVVSFHSLVLSMILPFLVCEKLLHAVSAHYHSYEVICPNPAVFCICKQSDLYDYSVLSLYHVNSLFVSLKYYLVEKL